MTSRSSVLLGVAVGAAFGLWNLVATQLDPLAEDSPAALLLFYGPMFAIWSAAGFVASRRSGRLLDGIKAGAIVAAATFVVFDLLVFVRVNLFLETISRRADWQNLLLRYQNSGFESFRAYANYEYITGAPFKALVSSIIGAVMGCVGGLFGVLARRQARSERIG